MEKYKHLTNIRLFNLFKSRRAKYNAMWKCSCGIPGCDEEIAPLHVRQKAKSELNEIKKELDSRNWKKPRKC